MVLPQCGEIMKALYLNDCYMKEFEATIESVKDDKYVVLDKTVFYPNSGGQPHDTGKLVRESDKKEFPVVFAGKFGGVISHEVSVPGLEKGDTVKGVIDWDRRYIFMRMHTAAHVLSRVIHQESGAHTSGNQLGEEQSRIDFTLENLDREKIQGWIDKANEVIAKKLPVDIKEITRDEAQEILEGPSKHLMADMDVLRLIDIEGLDQQTCGGTHLKIIGEIGKLELVKVKNKGKNNRRLYYSIS